MPTDCGTLEATTAFDSGRVTITSCPDPGQATVGSTVTVPVTIQNGNSVEAEVTPVILDSNGNVIGAYNGGTVVTVAANSERTLDVDLMVPDSPGTYDLTADARFVNPATSASTVSTATASRAQSLPGSENLPDVNGRGTLATAGAGAAAAGLLYTLPKVLNS